MDRRAQVPVVSPSVAIMSLETNNCNDKSYTSDYNIFIVIFKKKMHGNGNAILKTSFPLSLNNYSCYINSFDNFLPLFTNSCENTTYDIIANFMNLPSLLGSRRDIPAEPMDRSTFCRVEVGMWPG